MNIRYFIFVVLFFSTRDFCSIDTAAGIVNQGLSIAQSIKTLFQEPPKININDYLSTEEMDYRYKIILEDFLKYYTLQNSNFENINFNIKGKKKFLWWEIDPGDASEINRLNDMIDKVKEIFNFYKISYSKNTTNYPKGIDGFIMAIEDCLDVIATKRSLYSLAIMANIFYRNFLDISLDFESNQLVFQEDVLRYEELEKNLHKKMMPSDFSVDFSLDALPSGLVKYYNLILDLIAYEEYKLNFFSLQSELVKNIISELEMTYQLIFNSLSDKKSLLKSQKNKIYKNLFGLLAGKNQKIKNVIVGIEGKLF